MKCACGKDWPEDHKFCPDDGNELAPRVGLVELAEHLDSDADRSGFPAWKCRFRQWASLVRELMAKSDPRPLLTPETVDAIPDDVCKAIWDGYHPPRGSDPAPWGRAILRSVAAHCRVPQSSGNPGELDSAEADRIIDNAISRAVAHGANDTVAASYYREALDALRSRLTLKPRRLSETEDRKLVEFARRACLPGYINAGHAIAAEVARLWGLEVPEERPAVGDAVQYQPGIYGLHRFVTDCAPAKSRDAWIAILKRAPAVGAIAMQSVPAPAITAAEAAAFECAFESAEFHLENFQKDDEDAIPWRANIATARAVVERLKGETVAADATKSTLDFIDCELPGLMNKLGDTTNTGGELPAPVTSVDLSEDECKRFSQWLNFEGETGMAQARSTVAAINRILAARKAKDVADMQPPFEGPKHGFAVPDEANANVNGLTGDVNGND